MTGFNLVHSHSFQIEILGVTDGSSPEYFCKVEGLNNALKMEPYLPGGANRPYYRSNACETTDLILTRPLVEGKTKMTVWCEEAIDKGIFKLTQAHILVLNKEGKILAQWKIEDVYPKGIAITSFQLDGQADPAIGETITIGYSRLVRTK
ncbi:phage tail protein [Cardinium endosymbiont of Oedothorax gibbosus]|uniref:phage tail protein n=1 Tax=Cardinium endosymbiont of Oedothorax gibbosus TaxID=931101 RepID=UPI002024F39E|nr:phage tail protein [Cardinium endosymbiont of Oedothorax gibbosus]CAH2559990.1 Afp1-like phage tail tube protein [Cardinium endosymbiont of Oedothorax gibbosus]